MFLAQARHERQENRFLVILPESDIKGALGVAESIRLAVASWPGFKRPLTVSLGVAALAGENCTSEELVQRADRAMYQAKVDGRNRSCVFTSDMLEVTWPCVGSEVPEVEESNAAEQRDPDE